MPQVFYSFYKLERKKAISMQARQKNWVSSYPLFVQKVASSFWFTEIQEVVSVRNIWNLRATACVFGTILQLYEAY